MKASTVRIRHEELRRAEARLVDAETALLLEACEKFQAYQSARQTLETERIHFGDVWIELTPLQKRTLKPEFFNDAPRYIDAPRKRPDMTKEQFVEACDRRGFTVLPELIRIAPGKVVGLVYRQWPNWTKPKID